jgi:hypothetical protein
MGDDGPLPWKGSLSKGIKHRCVAQFLTHLQQLTGCMGVLGVDVVGDGVFIHGGFGVRPETTTTATMTTSML